MRYFIHSLKNELSLAKSALFRVPGFSATVIGTLAITLGALICIFSLNHMLLVKSLPYPDAENLLVLQHTYTEDGVEYGGAQTAPGMISLYKKQKVLAEMALMRDQKLLIADHPEQPNSLVSFITPEYFSLLKPAMHLGRTINEKEGFDQHQAVTVLSYDSWKKWYNSDKNIIGSKTMLGNVSFKIIGVTAADFRAPANRYNQAMDFWVPWDYQRLDVNNWGVMTRGLTALGKLKQDISEQQALSSLSPILNEGYTASANALKGYTAHVTLTPLKEIIVGDSTQVALLLLSGVVALLLIATSNVTNLFLSRAAEKQRTMAIQAAMGAKPAHLFTSMFAESFILCTVAGLLGLIVAGWGFVLLAELASTQLPRITELSIDGITLLFTVFIVLTLSITFAKLSSRVVKYDDLKTQLQSSGKGSGLQISKKIRNALIITQVTLASILLVGTSVVIEKALSTIMHPLGFNEKEIDYLRIARPKGFEGYAEQNLVELNLMTLEIKKALNLLPQVVQVSRSLEPIIELGSFNMSLEDVNGKRLGSFNANMVDHNYFDLIELPLVKGNFFAEQKDPKYLITEIILSESLANHLFPNKNPLGEILQIQATQPLKVVGVVKDYHSPGRTSDYSYQRYYLPYAVFSDLGFDIKLEKGAGLNKETLLPLLHAINPKFRIQELTSHSEMHATLIYKHKLTAGITIVLSLLALLLAAAGIYGVLNYSTQMRRYELGIHLAMGAKTHRVLTMVIKENIQPVFYGIAVSVVLTGLIYMLARQQLTTAIEFNFFAILSTVPVMLLVSLIACYLPVNKVINEDPVKALRNE
ncbi:MAG: putative ABC transport system permease protein [Cognaticolwellia sp.]|jgi:putative ABC transport system permease protein